MRARVLSYACSLAALVACGGGGLEHTPCVGQCADAGARLEVADVQRVVAQAVNEASARSAKATIAVVDRVGNVLAVFRMNGADVSITVDSGRGIAGGLEQISVVPDTIVAISKAISGAYLSSEGNAFSTRTASQIVQEHFLPREQNQPSGPLFGVQFSSLPCSDLNTRFNGVAPSAGPQRSPLGLSADPGGFPLYKNGALVGGVGVISDSVYGLDLNISDDDHDQDELIALAGTAGFAPPDDRRADRITADGKTFRYSDVDFDALAANPAGAPAFAAINGVAGALVAVAGYYDNALPMVAGTIFGAPESGIRPATGAFAALDGFVLVDATPAHAERFAPRDATDAAVTGAARLRTAEVRQLLASALAVANRARAQIRRPLGTPARVTISVVDTFGQVLGIVRTRDAPVFGTDVSLQKARTVAFFSNAAAASDLTATPDTQYLGNGENASIAGYVPAMRNFLGQPNALADGAFAYGDRSIGNLARPFYPDGIESEPPGPLSKPFDRWSIFSDGMQLDLVNSAIIKHVVFVLGGGVGADVGVGECTELPATPAGKNRLGNGLQIFAGGVPLYRGGTLVGAIGISGDGIDQDDMISFLGAHEGGLALGGAVGNAPPAIRADQLTPQGARLRYVQCPQAPYFASDEQNVCAGK